MNCVYCHHPCSQEKLYAVNDTSLWVCKNCPNKVKYRAYNNDFSIRYTLIYFFHNNEEFCYKKWNNEGDDYFFKLSGHRFMNIPKTDTITPSNIKDKFKLYLTFS